MLSKSFSLSSVLVSSLSIIKYARQLERKKVTLDAVFLRFWSLLMWTIVWGPWWVLDGNKGLMSEDTLHFITRK